VTNILVAGVGGQGVILASDIMADTFLEAGYDVKKSEVHGMAQRGGSVSSHVRFGEKVYSPIIKMGEVDYLCVMERMETLRWLNYCNKSTIILMDEVKVNPPIVNLGDMAEQPLDAPSGKAPRVKQKGLSRRKGSSAEFLTSPLYQPLCFFFLLLVSFEEPVAALLRYTLNSVPLPFLLCTFILPPNSSMILNEMERPSPVPLSGDFVV
jgi:hypothetical protein